MKRTEEISFSLRAKEEILAQRKKPSPCCEKAMLLGMLLFAARCDEEGIFFTTENEKLALKICRILKYAFGIHKTPEQEKNIPSDMPLYLVGISKKDEIDRIFGAYEEKLSERNRPGFFLLEKEKKCCADAVLKGAFLYSGYVSNPEKGYHLEFVAPGEKIARAFDGFLRENYGFSPRIIRRKQSYVVYFKESEVIEDMLALMGATASAIAIMEIKVERDVRNTVNRQVNCETANLTKTVDAYERHRQAIEKVARVSGLESLPAPLAEIANLRLEHPELSLKELGARLLKPVSKSGVNHRLNKIIAIADSLENRGEIL